MQAESPSVPSGRAEGAASAAGEPLVVDMDGTLTRVDTLYELFAAALFKRPLAAIASLRVLFTGGIAPFKRAVGELGEIDVETLPLREDLVAHLVAEKANGRSLHLATAADRAIAEGVAARVGVFDSVQASDGARNLKGPRKAERLAELFPDGFAYAGDHTADLPVWRAAKAAIVVASNGLERQVAQTTPVERIFPGRGGDWRAWAKAARPHQWAKNLLVWAPIALGWPQLTGAGLAQALAATALLCLLASLTYVINDVADVGADRRHPTKRARPFASGALPVRDGLVVGGLGIPLALAAGWAISPAVAACLAAYTITTLAYSIGLKRAPLLDVFLIGVLFSLRVALGVAAAGLEWSAWLMTFSIFFFFSLALAKRHTELVRAVAAGMSEIPGRGYRPHDKDITLVFGVSSMMAAVVLVVLYLVEEVFPLGAYAEPRWLWGAPAVMFLWASRIWLLANRGEMNDDPVVFALKDRVSLSLGGLLLATFLLALV
ncbi:MAG: UbiA family prenyltransferase [Phenylobacterium sp.]|uniref:UbiA family prenyltransferase n=1 Tax=Phenylobacterium sp. TaxID=1871053 RepID=UPI00391915E4